MANPAPVTLTLSIGDSIFALGARFPDLIHPDRMVDNSPATIDRPLHLTVVTEGQPLHLPPTRFAMIGQVAGVVTAIRTSPMLEFADLEAGDALANRLVAQARASGWTITEAFPSDLARMRAELAEPDRSRYHRSYAELRRGSATLHIYLSEATGAGLEGMEPPARGRLFLVNSDFHDEALEDRQNDRLFARRRELTGGTLSVPLTMWSKREIERAKD